MWTTRATVGSTFDGVGAGQEVNSRAEAGEGSPNAPWQKASHAPTHLTALSISLLQTRPATQTNIFALCKNAIHMYFSGNLSLIV